MFHELIEEISKELNIEYTYLSKDWIIRLVKDNIVKYLAGNKFDLNPHALGLILDDKYAFYDTLHSLNIPACIHHIFYRPNNKYHYAINCNTYEEIIKYFEKYQKNIVVKANNGSLGTDVYNITDKEKLIKTLDKLFEKNYSISVCPYYEIKNEYRVIVLNNEIKLIYKKIKPIIYGDGISTVKELLIKFNPYYFQNKSLPNNILKKDEEYLYDWRFNLSKGSIASDEIDTDIKEKLSEIALTVSKKVGIVFASIDIVELSDHSLLVLEANSGVSIDKCTHFLTNGKDLAKNIYKEAIITLFKH